MKINKDYRKVLKGGMWINKTLYKKNNEGQIAVNILLTGLSVLMILCIVVAVTGARP